MLFVAWKNDAILSFDTLYRNDQVCHTSYKLNLRPDKDDPNEGKGRTIRKVMGGGGVGQKQK